MDHLWTPWRMPYLSGEHEKPDGCVFCLENVDNDSENHIFYRGKRCFIILNRFPYNTGHLMVIPYAHVPTLEVLDAETLAEVMSLAQLSLRVLRETYGPQGFNLGVNIGEAAGAGVAEHIHLHIVPRWNGDTNYMTIVGKTRVIPEWLDQMYERLAPLFEDAARERKEQL
ncbi:MAG: HIT domain-containing protein [Anaerolineae bacterium]|nr:HIT domain-containing protein [Anaerolineae bacterium]